MYSSGLSSNRSRYANANPLKKQLPSGRILLTYLYLEVKSCTFCLYISSGSYSDSKVEIFSFRPTKAILSDIYKKIIYKSLINCFEYIENNYINKSNKKTTQTLPNLLRRFYEQIDNKNNSNKMQNETNKL